MGVRVAVRPAARVQPFGGYLGAVVRGAIDAPAVIAVPVEAPGAAASAVPGPGAADLDPYLGAGAADVIPPPELTARAGEANRSVPRLAPVVTPVTLLGLAAPPPGA